MGLDPSDKPTCFQLTCFQPTDSDSSWLRSIQIETKILSSFT
jgi:hypothetical protein